MTFEKKKRIKDPDLLAQVRLLPCLACSCDPERRRATMLAFDQGITQSHAHHVKTRGAGGDDVETNLMPLCIKHHNEIHVLGNTRMAEKYPVVKSWLIRTGNN
jgi:hypothetical protein